MSKIVKNKVQSIKAAVETPAVETPAVKAELEATRAELEATRAELDAVKAELARVPERPAPSLDLVIAMIGEAKLKPAEMRALALRINSAVMGDLLSDLRSVAGRLNVGQKSKASYIDATMTADIVAAYALDQSQRFSEAEAKAATTRFKLKATMYGNACKAVELLAKF